MLANRTVTLIVTGGIAAYKALELVRLLRQAGARVIPVMTRAAESFVTPLSLAALAEEEVHRDLFDLTREARMGHIALSRAADLVAVVPASADFLAKMAHGLADDLASTMVLATDTPVLVAPAMNVRMWQHPATRRNLARLREDGVHVVPPEEGAMACGETGEGRLAAPEAVLAAIARLLGPKPLAGRHVIVTSGPTREPIDPVRFIANRSSGRQGAAIARALADLGADVTFVTGPAEVPPPAGVRVVPVETAAEMLAAVEEALPADAAVFAAAVADWRVRQAASSKIKKTPDGAPPTLRMIENPDILAAISRHPDMRPPLVVGFAAETDDVLGNARAKRVRKGCDWIVANDVGGTGIMGGAENEVILVTAEGEERWPRMTKEEVARRLAERIVAALERQEGGG